MRMRMAALAAATGFFLALVSPAFADTDNYSACWGQASAEFAQMGVMGTHASEQEEPRDGLPNLAKDLYYDAGVLSAPTLQALGEYLVSIDPDLTVAACES